MAHCARRILLTWVFFPITDGTLRLREVEWPTEVHGISERKSQTYLTPKLLSIYDITLLAPSTQEG